MSGASLYIAQFHQIPASQFAAFGLSINNFNKRLLFYNNA